ncbi:MAG: protoporphyrinogen oxidase HemJ [Methylocystis sp.]|nr:protoporphyrinogen oxidase HemJ [Methylocystis sp.]
MYLWIKALHVIAVIAWMAGMLYLPRLFVYHSQVGPGVQSDTFKQMERRLSRFIMTPAMVVAWLAGLSLIIRGGLEHSLWLHAKLVLVVVLTFLHFYYVFLAGVFARDHNRHSTGFFRILNEIPTLLMIGVVILVVVKPF